MRNCWCWMFSIIEMKCIDIHDAYIRILSCYTAATRIFNTWAVILVLVFSCKVIVRMYKMHSSDASIETYTQYWIDIESMVCVYALGVWVQTNSIYFWCTWWKFRKCNLCIIRYKMAFSNERRKKKNNLPMDSHLWMVPKSHYKWKLP